MSISALFSLFWSQSKILPHRKTKYTEFVHQKKNVNSEIKIDGWHLVNRLLHYIKDSKKTILEKKEMQNLKKNLMRLQEYFDPIIHTAYNKYLWLKSEFSAPIWRQTGLGVVHKLCWQDFGFFLTTYPPPLTFSMVWTLTKSGRFWTTYLPRLVNVICEQTLN